MNKIVEAVGIASICRSGDIERSKRVQSAMSAAVLKAYDENPSPDPNDVRGRMMEARDKEYRKSFIAPGEPLGISEYATTQLVQASSEQMEALMVLLKISQSAAIGAAIAFLLQAADNNPGMLKHVLTQTQVSKNGRTISAFTAILETVTSKGG